MNSEARKALELIELGRWDAAHEMVQDNDDKMSCLIHAYLHREEGDNDNAAYWYRCAGESFPDNSLEAELSRLHRLAEK